MKQKRHQLALFIVTLALATPTLAADAKIKKCQDTTGKWHYGDNAAEACSQSKITVISDQGVAKKEIAAPPTAEELKRREAQRDELQKAEERVKEQVKRDEILLATYANEADIVFIRDRKIAQIESTIRASNDTLKSLRTALARFEAQAAAETKANKAVSENTTDAIERTRSQIALQETGIAQKRKEQDAVREKAESELQRFRDLKAKPMPTSAVPAKP